MKEGKFINLVAVAHLAERLPVEEKVAGSKPVSRPKVARNIKYVIDRAVRCDTGQVGGCPWLCTDQASPAEERVTTWGGSSAG